MNRRVVTASALMAALLLLAGCARPWLRPGGETLTDPVALEIARATLEHTYPPAYRLAQRVVVRAPGADLDLMGYLVVEKDGSFHALALADFGVHVLELRRAHGIGQVLRKPDAMPEPPLLHGVIGDIEHLFLPPPEGHRTWLRAGDGAPILLIDTGNRAIEYRFSPDGRFLTRSVMAERGTVLREATYSGYRLENPPGVTVPGRIVLRNRTWRYRLEIELLEIETGPLQRQ